MDKKRSCPNCGNPNCEEDHDYCWNCGIELQNCCTNAECPQLGLTDEDEYVVILPDHFTFCPYCGSQTRLAREGYISPLSFET